ncbi:MAG TPA: hypothetical protein VF317_12105 [Dermatophilaceae bacterium]|jgi:hypothetical protein
MKNKFARTGAIAALVCTQLVLSGCQSGGTTARPRASVPAPTATPRAQYIDLADRIAARKTTVWVEADLVKAWQKRGQRYDDVLNIAVKLASRPGVVGIKIADELGYHDGIDTPQQAGKFLAQASHDIRSRLPRTKILVDMIVPQLGCLAWVDKPATKSERSACATSAGKTSPAATIAAVDSYLKSKTIDVIDLSTGLRDTAEYSKWKTTPDEAMRAAWTEAIRRHWGTLVTLQARKAMAHPGSYTGGAAQAKQELRTYVDIPLANGARAVDIWTWSQPYKGTTYRLFDPGLRSNPLIAGLARRRAAGDPLFTHMTPSSLEVSPEADVAAATAIFTNIFVAAGAG